jgi:hypothetical protein
MMARPVALHLALDLAAMPMLAGVIQREPLPEGMLDVIKVAAGCPQTLARAARLTGERDEVVRDAAIVYLQTALFAPSADSYRVLGVSRNAPRDEMRRHLGWLMKWLHPDREASGWESNLAARVLGAWDEVKTAERRARYDRQHPAEAPPPRRPPGQWRRPWLPRVQGPVRGSPRAPVWVRRVAVGIVIGVAALTMVVAIDWLQRPAPAIDIIGGREPIGPTGSLEE